MALDSDREYHNSPSKIKQSGINSLDAIVDHGDGSFTIVREQPPVSGFIVRLTALASRAVTYVIWAQSAEDDATTSPSEAWRFPAPVVAMQWTRLALGQHAKRYVIDAYQTTTKRDSNGYRTGKEVAKTIANKAMTANGHKRVWGIK